MFLSRKSRFLPVPVIEKFIVDKAFKIAVFYDDRIGHQKQTDGILNALSQLSTVDIVYKKNIVPSLITSISHFFLFFLCFFRIRKQPNIDLIIGTGSHLHIPMLYLKRKTGAFLVCSMKPDLPFMSHFVDLAFIPVHDGIRIKENVFNTIGPPNLSQNKKQHKITKAMILIGGIDKKSHHWDSRQIVDSIKTIIEKTGERTWTISSSPRTPKDCIDMLEAFVKENPQIDFFKAEDTRKGWIEEEYNKNSIVWITADSMSMVYEAISAGCRVGVIPVKWKRKNNKFQNSLDYLLMKKLITDYDTWLLDSEMPEIPDLNEAKRCAEEIFKKWLT